MRATQSHHHLQTDEVILAGHSCSLERATAPVRGARCRKVPGRTRVAARGMEYLGRSVEGVIQTSVSGGVFCMDMRSFKKVGETPNRELRAVVVREWQSGKRIEASGRSFSGAYR